MTRCVYVSVEIWSMLRLWESIALMKPSVEAEKLTQPISQAGEYATTAVGSLSCFACAAALPGCR